MSYTTTPTVRSYLDNIQTESLPHQNFLDPLRAIITGNDITVIVLFLPHRAFEFPISVIVRTLF